MLERSPLCIAEPFPAAGHFDQSPSHIDVWQATSSHLVFDCRRPTVCVADHQRRARHRRNTSPYRRGACET